MVSSVYHAIGASRQIFIQAPTGVGKTMSTIFPAVRAVGEGKGETIFYLTAKTITRTVAQEALEVLREKGKGNEIQSGDHYSQGEAVFYGRNQV